MSNDTLLLKIIEKDMVNMGIEDYTIIDQLAEDPTEIKIGQNEIVYVHDFQANGEESLFLPNFYVELKSNTNLVSYQGGYTDNGKSNLITRHHGDIKVTGNPFPLYYFIHYARVKY